MCWAQQTTARYARTRTRYGHLFERNGFKLPLSNIVTAAPQRWVLEHERFPQLLAARARLSRSRPVACSSSAARSAGSINAWVGRTHAVGHRVMPLVRMNSATASLSSLDIIPAPFPASSRPPVGVIEHRERQNRNVGAIDF